MVRSVNILMALISVTRGSLLRNVSFFVFFHLMNLKTSFKKDANVTDSTICTLIQEPIKLLIHSFFARSNST